MGGIASPRSVVTADEPRAEDAKGATGKRCNMVGILGRGSRMAWDLYQGEFAMINRRRD